MITDDKEVFSGYIPLGDTLRSGTYHLRFYTKYLSSLPQTYSFNRQIIIGNRPFLNYRKESTLRVDAPYHIAFFPEGGHFIPGCSTRVAFKALGTDGLE